MMWGKKNEKTTCRSCRTAKMGKVAGRSGRFRKNCELIWQGSQWRIIFTACSCLSSRQKCSLHIFGQNRIPRFGVSPLATFRIVSISLNVILDDISTVCDIWYIYIYIYWYIIFTLCSDDIRIWFCLKILRIRRFWVLIGRPPLWRKVSLRWPVADSLPRAASHVGIKVYGKVEEGGARWENMGKWPPTVDLQQSTVINMLGWALREAGAWRCATVDHWASLNPIERYWELVCSVYLVDRCWQPVQPGFPNKPCTIPCSWLP